MGIQPTNQTFAVQHTCIHISATCNAAEVKYKCHHNGQWQSGSHTANKLAVNAATICIYAFFDKYENASRSSFRGRSRWNQQCLVYYVFDDNGATDSFFILFCSSTSVCYFTIVTATTTAMMMTTTTTVTMTMNRAVAFGMRKWRRNAGEKSQTHMANTIRQHTFISRRKYCFMHVSVRACVVGDTVTWSDVMAMIVITCIAPQIVHKHTLSPRTTYRRLPPTAHIAHKGGRCISSSGNTRLHLWWHSPSSSISCSLCMNAMQIVTDLQCLINSVPGFVGRFIPPNNGTCGRIHTFP